MKGDRRGSASGGRRGPLFVVFCLAAVGVVVVTSPVLGGAAPATASCSVGETYPEPGESVLISAFDSQDADAYQYDTDGDGGMDTDLLDSPFYETNYSAGTYRPAVRAVNTTEDTSDTADCPELVVGANSPPTARLDYSPSTPVVGERVTFDANASTDADGEILFLYWDYGADGSFEESESVETGIDYRSNRTYNTTGTKLVRVVLEDNDGNRSSTTVEVPVGEPNEPPTARFDYSPDPAVAGQETTLDASNSTDPDGQITRYEWDFDGDGTVDNRTSSPVVSHTFPASAADAGFANVRLTVVDDGGANDTTTRDVIVVSEGPVARCTVEPTTVAPGEVVTVDASASENADQYQFDFGYRSFGDFRDDPVANTSYPEPGTYEVRVRAWDSASERSNTTSCGDVTVREQIEPPTAAFTYRPGSPLTGQQVTFDASNSTDPDGQVVSYAWDFDGDGTVDFRGSSPTATYVYSSAGSYPVTLTVRDGDNATDAATRTVVVDSRPEPVASCTVTPTTVAPGEEVTIDATGSENVDQYQFDTGSGSFGDFRADPVLRTTYDEPGNYTVRVRAWDTETERSDVATCGNVTVERPNEPPTASFTVKPRSALTGETVTFDGSASSDPDGTIVRYEWDFDGDGVVDDTTTSPTTTHQYGQADSYLVVLRVVDDDNATDAAERDLGVERPPDPIPRCRVSNRTVAPGEAVTIDASRSENVDRYQFDPGTGSFDDLTESATRTVSYDEPGTYVPLVRVWALPGERSETFECPDVTVRRPNEPPTARFTVSNATVLAGRTVRFDASASSDPDGQVVRYAWDFDGDGTRDAVTTNPVATHAYPSAQHYSPHLVVFDDDNATDETLRRLSPPDRPVPGTDVRTDAPRTDAGTATEPGPPTETEPGPRTATVGPGTTPGGGTDGSADDGVPVPLWWGIPIAGLAGTGAGLALCRGLSKRRRSPAPPRAAGGGGTIDGGITAVAAGTFETPAGGGTVSIADVGFEPDVLLFTATNNVPAGAASGETHRTDGWTYGVACRNGTGGSGAGGSGAGGSGTGGGASETGGPGGGATGASGASGGGASGMTQEVVSVANDSQREDAAVGSAHTGQVLDVVVHDETEANGIAGRVTATTDAGFEFEVDTSALPADQTAGRYQVAYRAFRTAPGADTEVGHFLTPAEAGTQTVPLSGQANYARFLATNVVTGQDATSVVDRSVGFCHGHAAGVETPSQTATTSTVDPADPLANAYGTFEDRVLQLVDLEDRGITGRTTARVTGLGGSIDLEYDEVSATGGVGDPRRLVTYLAVDAGDEVPATGTFRMPDPETDEDVVVDCGVDPAGVEVTGCNVTTTGADQVVTGNSLSFGWSHGDAVRTADGVYQQVLQSVVGPGIATTYADLFDTIDGSSPTAAPGSPTGRDAQGGERTGRGVQDGGDLPVPDAVAVLATLNADGHVTGWEQLSVTRFTRFGFEGARTGVSDAEGPAERARPRLTYTAWPVSDDV